MTAEIAQAYNDREEEESEDKPAKVPVEKLYELANEIVPYCMRHNGMPVHTHTFLSPCSFVIQLLPVCLCCACLNGFGDDSDGL